MSSSSAIVRITESAEGRTPLLQNSSAPSQCIVSQEEEINSPNDADHTSTHKSTDHKQRLASLDVFRGLTVAFMILVDDAGKAFPLINHSPWFGVTFADFVMPFFLFIVGVSASLVFKNVNSKLEATKKVIVRTIKLFLLGVFLQGGYFHGRGLLTYGVDIKKIRWMGVLQVYTILLLICLFICYYIQRIAIGYLLVSISEIWFVSNVAVDSLVAFLRKYRFQFVFVVLLGTTYMCLLYGLYVPNWAFEISSVNLTSSTPSDGSGMQIVHCEVRGSLEPPCNAVALVDRLILGEQHLYQRPVYRRTKECSVNSPDYGPLPQDSPGWCLAPFDPEGILSSLMAAITCFAGLHYGHIIVHAKCHMKRVLLWSASAFPLLVAGYALEVLGVPFSKPLYTLSYTCITTGASGILLSLLFYIVDVKHIRKPTMIFQWMGLNSLVVYALAACDLFPAALQGFYWRSPANNLVDGTELLLQSISHSKKWGTLAFVMLEIIFWGLVSGVLHLKRVYVKL